MAECHPVGFQWVMEAKRRGATIIHVDPRYTRTSAVADLHVPLRPGSDVAFLGGLVHYILEHDRWFKEYVVAYTNASAVIREGYQDTDELDGYLRGWGPAEGNKEVVAEHGAGKGHPLGGSITSGIQDPTLQHPRCVFQLLKRHYARY